MLEHHYQLGGLATFFKRRGKRTFDISLHGFPFGMKKSCRRCEKIAQEPAPSRPIPRGMAGPALLAHILVAKFDDHLPLYRQGEIFARLGADIPRSTLIDWCGQAVRVLRPLIEKIKENVLSADRLHADDTPIAGPETYANGWPFRRTRS